MSKFFPENVSGTGYNMKITRYRKSILKIMPVWPGLRPLALKSKFKTKFEFSENLEEFVRRPRPIALQQLFSMQIFLFYFKTSDCHKISFFNDGGPKHGYFDIFKMLSAFVKL